MSLLSCSPCLVSWCKEFCLDLEEETEKIQRELTLEKLNIRDSTSMSLLHLDERVDVAMNNIFRVKSFMKNVDDILWPREQLEQTLEAYLT